MVGGVGHQVGDLFLQEVGLWFGCPAEKMVQIVQLGGLSMIAVGLSFLFLSRSSDRAVTDSERLGLKLCISGLVAEVLTGGALYLVFDFTIFSNFYFQPIVAVKNVWLGAQLLSFSTYLAGMVLVLGGVKQAVDLVGQPA